MVVSAEGRRRWLLTGSGGAGKSTLARRLATALDLPLIHLDREYWKPGWVETPRDEWRERVAELISGDEWVMDGNYGGTIDMRLARADVVIVMDTPTWKCLARILKRRWFDSARPDLAPGCPDQLNVEFAWWVLRYQRQSRPRVMRALEAHPDVECIRLRSDRDTEELMSEVYRTTT